MTLGALLAGAWLRERRVAAPLRLYGALELAIGVAGLAMLPGFELLRTLDAGIYAHAAPLAPALQGLGVMLVLAPATLAMGASRALGGHGAPRPSSTRNSKAFKKNFLRASREGGIVRPSKKLFSALRAKEE